MSIDLTRYQYEAAYREGYADGYHESFLMWQEECQKLVDVLRAMLGDGEAPEHDKKGDI